jgi:cell wall-associated NlpC family hydrolase
MNDMSTTTSQSLHVAAIPPACSAFDEASLADLLGIPFTGEGKGGEAEMDCYALVHACVTRVHGPGLPATPAGLMAWPHRQSVLHEVSIAAAAAGDVLFTTAPRDGHEQQHVAFVLPGLRVLQARRGGRSHHVSWPMMARFIRTVYRIDGRALRSLGQV